MKPIPRKTAAKPSRHERRLVTERARVFHICNSISVT
jgi:hypothetical protein